MSFQALKNIHRGGTATESDKPGNFPAMQEQFKEEKQRLVKVPRISQWVSTHLHITRCFLALCLCGEEFWIMVFPLYLGGGAN